MFVDRSSSLLPTQSGLNVPSIKPSTRSERGKQQRITPLG
jgi:hypothetical protein